MCVARTEKKKAQVKRDKQLKLNEEKYELKNKNDREHQQKNRERKHSQRKRHSLLHSANFAELSEQLDNEEGDEQLGGQDEGTQAFDVPDEIIAMQFPEEVSNGHESGITIKAIS